MNTSKLALPFLMLYFVGCVCQSCDLNHLQTCLGNQVSLLPAITTDPFDEGLFHFVKFHYCKNYGVNTHKCVTNAKETGCVDSQLLEYDMLISTISAMCRSSTYAMESCMANKAVRTGLSLCFLGLQRNLYNELVINEDQESDRETAVCKAYKNVKECANYYGKWYSECAIIVQNILHARTSYITEYFGCSY